VTSALAAIADSIWVNSTVSRDGKATAARLSASPTIHPDGIPGLLLSTKQNKQKMGN
jgi:hypothetical protein